MLIYRVDLSKFIKNVYDRQTTHFPTSSNDTESS